MASDWTPKKLNVEVQMPDTLDLESLRARGPQPGEQLQPEGPAGGTLATHSRLLSAAGAEGLLSTVFGCTEEQLPHVTSDGHGPVISVFDVMHCRQHQRSKGQHSGRRRCFSSAGGSRARPGHCGAAHEHGLWRERLQARRRRHAGGCGACAC